MLTEVSPVFFLFFVFCFSETRNGVVVVYWNMESSSTKIMMRGPNVYVWEVIETNKNVTSWRLRLCTWGTELILKDSKLLQTRWRQ